MTNCVSVENSLRYVGFPQQEEDFDWIANSAIVVRHNPGVDACF